jgi:hypothetical protein
VLSLDAQSMLQNTTYLMEQMQTRFSHWHPTRVNNLSNTIFFRKPNDRIVKKYSLATMYLEINHVKHDYAHVVVMPHVTQEVLSEFLSDLDKDPITRL